MEPLIVDQVGMTWNPGVHRRFPWLGVIPLILSICCTGLAIGVVLASSGQPEAVWSGHKQPVVTIIVTITSFLRGPLMQRASFVQIVDLSRNGTVDLQVKHNISDTWGGTVDGRDTRNVMFTSEFAQVTRDFQAKAPIHIKGASCENCTLTVKAFGFDVDHCEELTSSPTNYNLTVDLATIGNVSRIFESAIDIWFEHRSFTALNISTKRKAHSDGGDEAYPQACSGKLVGQTCILVPSVVAYNISITGGQASFQTDSWKDDHVLEHINLTWPVSSVGSGITILPLQVVGSTLFNSIAEVWWSGAVGWATKADGLTANLYTGNWSAARSPCHQFYLDPMDDIINSYRELAFRMSVHAANNPGHDSLGVPLPREEQKGIPYTSHLTQVQYAANIPELLLAVAVSLAGPVATMVLLWGWWRLGRSFSMSPLELAYAFSSPPEKGPYGKSSLTLLSDSKSDLGYNGGGGGGVTTMQQENEAGGMDGLFVDCDSTASAGELADHFRNKGKGSAGGGGGGGEPKIQYGVVNGEGGRFSFAVVEGL
ncbi:hypothetical protein NEUTE1DRAFT_79876 [Neurospora tetrasperma FGSC 2508]|uniref:Uncharacterized protein n=1 Tax=Neurospora tetrasperma (strain FGSC 2508 / ATCC MYA-4615 / P0657) TaxID=510951 RepID=F8MHE6_NEUT8|nr:uncharacterized protein NEUTE1DRAFT_79876 [Neurospora tetrasperma FGSC 2508]EGO59609.1 hypothetical protein NEUTE1DRAFT_79876 [Neurospora tetrasperma FGSC 2508]EGZ73737.1 hypothetical protein NEUTE2DRAFT_157144 [Neurospora tetrasperma FGSC 2509]